MSAPTSSRSDNSPRLAAAVCTLGLGWSAHARPLWFTGAAGGLVAALLLLPAHWPELTHNLSDRVLQAGNLLLLSLVFTVIKVLHELGHGFAAIWQGDDTPRETGHMTLDPMVHMGGFSILLLLIVGIFAIVLVVAILALRLKEPIRGARERAAMGASPETK